MLQMGDYVMALDTWAAKKPELIMVCVPNNKVQIITHFFVHFLVHSWFTFWIASWFTSWFFTTRFISWDISWFTS